MMEMPPPLPVANAGKITFCQLKKYFVEIFFGTFMFANFLVWTLQGIENLICFSHVNMKKKQDTSEIEDIFSAALTAQTAHKAESQS